MARMLCRSAGQSAGDNARLFPAVRGLWEYYNTRGDFEAACELAGQCQKLAAGAGERNRVADADFCLGVSSMFVGRLVEGRERLNRSVVSVEAHGRRDLAANEVRGPRIIALVHLAQAFRDARSPSLPAAAKCRRRHAPLGAGAASHGCGRSKAIEKQQQIVEGRWSMAGHVLALFWSCWLLQRGLSIALVGGVVILAACGPSFQQMAAAECRHRERYRLGRVRAEAVAGTRGRAARLYRTVAGDRSPGGIIGAFHIA